MSELEEIQQRINKATDITAKLELMYRLAEFYWRTDQQKIPAIMQELIAQAQAHDIPAMEVKGIWMMGSWYRSNLKIELAAEHFKKALELAVALGRHDLRAQILNSFGALYHNTSKLREAIGYFEQSRDLAKECGDIYNEAIAMLNISACLHNMGKFTNAIQGYFQAKQLFESIQPLQPGIQAKTASLIKMLGGLAMEIGDTETAIRYYLQSLKIFELHDDLRGKSDLLIDMGTAYANSGQPDRAFKSYDDALVMSELAGDRYQRVILLCMMANLFFETGNFEKGWESLSRADEHNTESQANILLAMILHFKGIGYRLQKEFLKAAEVNAKSLSIGLEIGNIKMICAALLVKGMIFEDQNNFQDAVRALGELIDRAEKQSYKGEEYFKGYEALCRIHEGLGDFKKATECYKKYADIKKDQAKLRSEFATAAVFAEFETERTRQEAEIYRLKNVELAEANARLMELSEERKEFISIAAHDLKNPLYSIKMVLQSIKPDLKNLLPHVSEAIADVESASSGMIELIQNLLDTEAIETGKLQFNRQSFKADEAVSIIIKRYEDAALVKNISFQLEILPDMWIYADQQYFLQIIDNVLSNAIKYSEFGRNIFIRLFKNNNSIRLEIQDEGPGINADDMKKLFGKFQRLSARPTGNENSTGLGLAIVKKLVEAMSGRIWCESEIGRGSTFIAEFPVE